VILTASSSFSGTSQMTDSSIVRRVGNHSTVAKNIDGPFNISAKIIDLRAVMVSGGAISVAQPLIPWLDGSDDHSSESDYECHTMMSALRIPLTKRQTRRRMNQNPHLSRIRRQSPIRFHTSSGPCDRSASVRVEHE
jgi:hypothetical protein